MTDVEIGLNRSDKCGNHLLAVLPKEECERIYPHLRRVNMPLGKALYESGDRQEHVYFPTTSIVSLFISWRMVHGERRHRRHSTIHGR